MSAPIEALRSLILQVDAAKWPSPYNDALAMALGNARAALREAELAAATTTGRFRASVSTFDRKDWSRRLAGDVLNVVLRGSDVIAVVWCGDDRDGEEAANARLFAAAPDMLAALEMALASGLIRARDPVNDPGTLCPVHDAITAVIAKARGRS